ncbi:hypothetical protein BESB_021120 [Besnoitia besnoiti]|uniref:Uncharacterized protein n=1 Tax=Besnoitia besnoiti TaxID=94643 RepID=A0A2A9M792_BESBE|nr:hypothetical protein BESB_021120 [Besnoitia besnoiti]PFH32171.1 hypothetical protein BESB_021120 [Besnoitia besnoiti]
MPSPMASLEHDKRSLVHQRRLAEAPAQQNKRTTQKNPSPHEGRMEEVPLGQHPFVRQKVEELVETRVPREQTVMKAVSRLATLRTTSQYHASSVGKWETENFETWVKSYGGREAADDLPPQEQRRAVGFPTWRAPPPTPNGYGSRQTLGGGIGWRRPCGWSSSGCGTRSPNALEALTLPVGQTHWEKGVHCRVLESVNREATRMAIVQSEFSRNVAGRVDADAGKAMMDKDASSWWPNPQQQKDAEAKVLSVMGERNFNCLLAATLLVNPVVQEYVQWLVQAEAKGVRELTVLLEEEMAIARGGTRLAFGAELMELHLRGLAARPATWKDGPSSELLLWLANQHLRNRQNVLPRQKGGRLPRSRQLASPSLGARVLDPIEEEDLPGEGSESGLGGAGITDKLSPAGRRPGSATRSPTSKSTLQLERCGFSLKDKICLRGEIPGLNLILRDLSQQYKDKDPNKAVAMMREAILISLGDALFSRMMERRALKWHPAGSGKKTGTFSRKERLQVAPLNQWKDLLR